MRGLESYGNEIRFIDNPQCALAFYAITHPQPNYPRNAVLGYQTSATEAKLSGIAAPFRSLTSATKLTDWRRLLNVLVHHCPRISKIGLIYDRTIWDSAS